jgi:hypothetical protein
VLTGKYLTGSAHLIGECIDRHTESPGETEITNLELAFSVNEQILWLEITMKNLVLVTEGSTLE